MTSKTFEVFLRLVTALVGSVIFSASALAQQATVSTARETAGLAEIVVTAEKRSERLQDVPVPVTAITADSLLENNRTQLQDYFREVPNVTLNTTGDGQNALVIRGIVTGIASNPTVGITIDDIPVGSSSAYGYGNRLAPDLDPADLSRVEVLRGPQGTLYGAASLGGLFKYVTSDPSLTELKGRGELDGSSVDHGGQGYGARGAVSIPLISDHLGFSVSAFKREDAGFIDDPTQGRKDVNTAYVKGAHAALLWKPFEVVSIKLAAFAQDTHSDGTNAVDANAYLQPTLGDLEQSRPPGVGGYESKLRLYSAAITLSLSRYQLVSLSGYSDTSYLNTLQFNNVFFGGLSQQFFGVSGNSLLNAFDTKKFSQELRLTSPSGETLEWMLGGFYTHEHTSVDQILNAVDPATGAAKGQLIDFSFPTIFKEYAIFGDLTAHFTDRFDVQFGGRQSWNKQTYDESDFGPAGSILFGSNPFVFPEQSTKDDAFTYLVTPRFRVSPEMMLYARFASGYRPGGNNGEATAFNLPLSFKPDKTLNYELGVKGSLFDRALSYDASIFYIDWKDIQIEQVDPVSGLGFFSNGGKARSDGAEIQVQAAPWNGMTVGATAAYNDAVLKSDLPISAGVGFSGDRLPYSAQFAGTLSADQKVPLGRLTGFVGGTLAYTGDRLGAFVNPISVNPLVPGNRNTLPAYTTLDLRAGVDVATWRVGLFVANVGDKRGILNATSQIQGSARYTDPYAYTPIRPRTYGMSVTASF